MNTDTKLATERMSTTTNAEIETQTNEVIELVLKLKLGHLNNKQIENQFNLLSDEIVELSKQELEKIGINLSLFHIELN